MPPLETNARMKQYYRVMLGKQSSLAEECLTGNFVGAHFGIDEDLTRHLPEEWRAFNKMFVPKLLAQRPDKTRIGAGLSCGMLWTVSKGLRPGDIVLCPDGDGTYRLGEIVGEYYYAPGETLPHRRRVRWLDATIARAAMSDPLRATAGFGGTVTNLTKHSEEIERLLGHVHESHSLVASGPADVEDLAAFAMEKHLEEFLVANWGQTLLAKDWDIFEEEGEQVGQQYPTDAGTIDLLAISKDRRRLLVVELKRGRATDVVVGQVLRYIGYVREQVAEDDQQVEGAIIALEDDQKMRWALLAVPSISFYRYQVSFDLPPVWWTAGLGCRSSVEVVLELCRAHVSQSRVSTTAVVEDLDVFVNG